MILSENSKDSHIYDNKFRTYAIRRIVDPNITDFPRFVSQFYFINSK